MASKAENTDLNLTIKKMKSDMSNEKARYQSWKISGTIASDSPESTKIFVDEDRISINSVGKFTASLLLECDERQNAQLPTAVCFFKKGEGYHVIDLTKKELASIDASSKHIEIKELVKLSIPKR